MPRKLHVSNEMFVFLINTFQHVMLIDVTNDADLPCSRADSEEADNICELGLQFFLR
jgi:hypothetical protein